MARFVQRHFPPKAYSQLSLFRRSRLIDLLFVTYGLLIAALVIVSFLAGSLHILSVDPHAMDIGLLNQPPGTPGHPLGTDFMGRDMLVRLVIGIQAYFLPGLLAVIIALVGGSACGLVSAYWGGLCERLVTYGSNLMDSFPRLVLILLLVATVKPDIYIIMAVVGAAQIPVVASMVKSKVLFLKQKNFIEAAVALGIKRRTILMKHVLWLNCRSLLIIQATLGMAEVILIETSLSYLGFGVQEPVPSWGNMVQSGANYFLQGDPWPSTIPALAILFTILGFHLLGDGLNNILERKQGL